MNRTLLLTVVAVTLLTVGCSNASRPAVLDLTPGPGPAAPLADPTGPAANAHLPTRPTTPPASTTSKPCGPGELAVSQSGHQGTAGSRHADFTVKHTRPGKCTVAGWPDFRPTDHDGHPIHVLETHVGSPGLVLLDSRSAAHFGARISLVTCNSTPVDAPYVTVSVMGQPRLPAIALTGLPICPDGVVEVSALQS